MPVSINAGRAFKLPNGLSSLTIDDVEQQPLVRIRELLLVRGVVLQVELGRVQSQP